MPEVPVYGERRVALGPATSAKARNVSAPAFGEQIGRGLESVARAGNAFSEFADRRAEEAAETAAKDLDLQYANFERETLFSGENAYFKQQGRNALLARTAAEEALENKRRELEAQANTPRAAELFGQIASRRLEASRDRIASFALKAEQDDFVATSEARLETQAGYAGAAWGDPKAQAQQLATGDAEVYSIAKKMGWSADITKVRIEQFRTKAHELALTEIVSKDPSLAEDYLSAHGDEMDPKTRIAWAAKLRPVVDQDAAINAAMAAWEASGGDLDASLEAIGKNKGLKPRQIIQAQDVLRQQFNLREAADTERRESALQEAFVLVNQGTAPSLLPAAMQELVAPHMGALEEAAKRHREGLTQPRNGPAFLALRSAAVDEPEAFQKITTPELIATGMDPADVAELIALRGQMKAGKDVESDVDKGYKVAVERAITMSGGVLGTGNARAKTRLAEAKASIYAYLQYRKAQGQDITDAVITQAVGVAMNPRLGSTAGAPPAQYAFESTPGQIVRPSAAIKEIDPALWNKGVAVAKALSKDGVATNGAVGDLLGYYEATGYRSMVPYREISRENRDTIVRWLKANGRPVNEASIEERYTRILLSKAK